MCRYKGLCLYCIKCIPTDAIFSDFAKIKEAISPFFLINVPLLSNDIRVLTLFCSGLRVYGWPSNGCAQLMWPKKFGDLVLEIWFHNWITVEGMGGGTFFKVGGGTSARWKEIIANFVVWIGNCDVTSIEIWHYCLYTIWRSKLHYFRQNYTTIKTYRWTTWNSNRHLQGDPGNQRRSG